jgi:O-antigen ligase
MYLFITFLRQNPDKNPCMPGVIKKWFSPWFVFAVLTILIAFNVAGGYLTNDLERGFGNSRVNFSIWLMQIVALVFFSTLMDRKASKKIFLVCLILLTPAFVLQNMTGGRSGLVGTVLLVSVFAYRWGGIKALVTSFLWLYLVAFLVANFYPFITPENNLNVFRNLEPTGYLISNEVIDWNKVIAWLDKVSSYRVSIVITAFSTLNLKDMMMGMGLGNFVGWAPTYPELGMMEVHNVMLKILGEYGIFGFFSALFLVFWPFAYRPADGRHLLALYLQSVYVVVAMVHPDLMMTAVNISLVYFACYADSLSARPAVSTKTSVAF